MNTTEYLVRVAYVAPSDIEGDDWKVYKSTFDGSYITRIGMEDSIKFLADKEITEQLTHGVGYSPKNKKWYGWSHRAVHGFEMGSICKKGDIHYIGANMADLREDAIRFWQGENRADVRCEGVIEKDGKSYFDIKWDYKKSVPNEELRGAIGGRLHYIKAPGRGEWTAVSMTDARQMAVDFNENVS